MNILTKPIKIKQGDTFFMDVTWLDKQQESIHDLDLFDIRCQFRKTPHSSLLCEASTENSLIEIFRDTIKITLTPEQTKLFVLKRGVFDLEVAYPFVGIVKTILSGKFLILEDVAYDD